MIVTGEASFGAEVAGLLDCWIAGGTGLPHCLHNFACACGRTAVAGTPGVDGGSLVGVIVDDLVVLMDGCCCNGC